MEYFGHPDIVNIKGKMIFFKEKKIHTDLLSFKHSRYCYTTTNNNTPNPTLETIFLFDSSMYLYLFSLQEKNGEKNVILDLHSHIT